MNYGTGRNISLSLEFLVVGKSRFSVQYRVPLGIYWESCLKRRRKIMSMG